MSTRHAAPRPGRARLALALTPALVVTAVFFYAGVGSMVTQSLGLQRIVGDDALSLSAYRDLWADPAVRDSVGLTLRVAFIATAVSAICGVALALGMHRLGRRSGWAMRIVQANIAVPHIVGALAITLVLSQTGLVARLAYAVGLVNEPGDFVALTSDPYGIGIMVELIWKETPFLALVALAALGRSTTERAGAARVLGAGRWHVFRHVTWPAIAAPVAAASALVFVFAIGSYEVPYLLGQPYPATLAVVAYDYHTDIDLAYRAEASAVAVLMTAMCLASLALMGVLLRRLAARRA